MAGCGAHDAVAKAHHEHEQSRDTLLDCGEEDAEDHWGHTARAACVEADVVKVPRGGFDSPKEDDGRDARLQRQQLCTVAQAEHEPHHTKTHVREGERAEKGQEGIELTLDRVKVDVGVEGRGRARGRARGRPSPDLTLTLAKHGRKA